MPSASLIPDTIAPSFGVNGRTENGQRVCVIALIGSSFQPIWGQIYPFPSGDLKQPTDSGKSCFGSHRTTFGKSTVKAIVARNTTYIGRLRTSALPKPTPTYFDATSSDNP